MILRAGGALGSPRIDAHPRTPDSHAFAMTAGMPMRAYVVIKAPAASVVVRKRGGRSWRCDARSANTTTPMSAPAVFARIPDVHPVAATSPYHRSRAGADDSPAGAPSRVDSRGAAKTTRFTVRRTK
jgi:hypothetical protein